MSNPDKDTGTQTEHPRQPAPPAMTLREYYALEITLKLLEEQGCSAGDLSRIPKTAARMACDLAFYLNEFNK